MSHPRGEAQELAGAASPQEPGTGLRAAARHVPTLLQVALALWIVRLYAIEGDTFFRVFALATAGFVVNLLLPLRLRLPFFVLLSLAGAVLVFGWIDAAWLVAAGLALIGICHLPMSIAARVMALLGAGLALAVARGGWIGAPWSVAVWPILGSMFMFRLALYMLAAKAGRVDGGFWTAAAYFFMLPNLAFPLFPVIDYQTFRRTYYDKDEDGIYQQGTMWIARGLVHLLLYRLVYQRVLLDPVDVVGLGDLVQFMLGTFLLYLRVSGQFHLIVGVLHLFGFRLPETHKLYYLAHSFTELWRRINIYWTDFMMKAVFYPTWFKVKHLPPTRALVLSTAMVFVVTWILHSYQWFWLRGGFPMTAQDTLFWGILGALVVAGAVRESKAGRKVARAASGWSGRQGLRAAVTFSLFCFLWSLWSTESVAQWIWMLGAAANVDAKGVAFLALTLALVTMLGGRDWVAARGNRPPWLDWAFRPAVRTAGALLLMLVAAQPATRAVAPPAIADGLAALHTTGLNARDAALQHRGYYEQLDVRAQLNAEVLDVVARRANWQDLSQIGVIRDRQDVLVRDLHPSRHVMWNGNTFTTNRWGMRDKEYAREKPPGTLRIAILGPSHVMGNGVADGESFEALVEDRLNAAGVQGYDRVEILNFGVDGYSLPQQIAILEDRVLDFHPDVVIATHYQRNRAMTESYLLKVVWGGYDVPWEPVRLLLAEAGLANIDRGTIPVPFEAGRRVARWLGLHPRMPETEASARVHRVADRVLEWSIAHFAEVTAQRGIVPAILGLNVVIDDVPAEVPNEAVIHQLGLSLFDLFDVFPPAERPGLRITPWDDHPNARGHRLIADRLYDELVPLLASRHAESTGSAPATSSH